MKIWKKINYISTTHVTLMTIRGQYIREEVLSQEPEEKPARKSGKAHTGKEEGALVKKLCKNCNQPFETSNPIKETCSDKCRSAFSRRKNN